MTLFPAVSKFLVCQNRYIYSCLEDYLYLFCWTETLLPVLKVPVFGGVSNSGVLRSFFQKAIEAVTGFEIASFELATWLASRNHRLFFMFVNSVEEQDAEKQKAISYDN